MNVIKRSTREWSVSRQGFLSGRCKTATGLQLKAAIFTSCFLSRIIRSSTLQTDRRGWESFTLLNRQERMGEREATYLCPPIEHGRCCSLHGDHAFVCGITYISSSVGLHPRWPLTALAFVNVERAFQQKRSSCHHRSILYGERT